MGTNLDEHNSTPSALSISTSPDPPLLSLPLRAALLLALLAASLSLPARAPPRASHLSRLPRPLACAPGSGASWRWVRASGTPWADESLGPLELALPGCPVAPAEWRQPARAAACLRGRHIVMVGDSTMRQQYLSLIKALDTGSWETQGERHWENMQGFAHELNSSGQMDLWLRWSAQHPPHICDCARCEGNEIFEAHSAWEASGTRILCNIENRYYVSPWGTRVTFILLLGRRAMGWNDASFLGADCLDTLRGGSARGEAARRCPQRGCDAGECFPPTRAAPALAALEEHLANLAPVDEVVLSAGPWGVWEGAGAANADDGTFLREAVATLQRVAAKAAGKLGGRAPRFWWKTPHLAAPGREGDAGVWGYTTARSPRVEAAFRAEGWGVIDAGGLLASATAVVAESGSGNGAWPYAEAHPEAQAAAEASLLDDAGLREPGASLAVVMSDFIHPAAWALRHTNSLLFAHLCSA